MLAMGLIVPSVSGHITCGATPISSGCRGKTRRCSTIAARQRLEIRAYERKVAMSVRGLVATAAGGLVIALAAGSTSPLHAQATPAPAKTSANGDVKADRKFIREFASDNMLEASLGKLAEQKAENPAVKQFGQRMDTDHNKIQNDWVNMATKNGLALKTGMGQHHRAKLVQLQKLSGKAFDKAYMTTSIRDHKDDIDYFQREGGAAHSSQVRDLVASTLPTLQDHFTQAKQVGAQVGADTTAALRAHAMVKKSGS
jgi:putative membrane protein